MTNIAESGNSNFFIPIRGAYTNTIFKLFYIFPHNKCISPDLDRGEEGGLGAWKWTRTRTTRVIGVILVRKYTRGDYNLYGHREKVASFLSIMWLNYRDEVFVNISRLKITFHIYLIILFILLCPANWNFEIIIMETTRLYNNLRTLV